MAEAGVGTTAHVASGQVIGTALGGDLALAALSLARRFAAGGTMWCLAPAWPEHARHVAVEFVHPVIVGKRALPAVSVIEPDPVAVLRATVRTGDVILAVGAADAPGVAPSLQRASVWGATSIWLGAGPRPRLGVADHVLWIEDPVQTASHDGRLVLLYHVLWELTHVCLEHPGLLAPDSGPAGGMATCVTCSDEGRMAEVVEVQQSGSAVVRTASGPELIDTTIVGSVMAGDLVLIHAGSAIAVLEDAGGDE
jgi:hydrogenase maturation factor